ncbi:hypothetical protein JB92DRAFT_2835753 [Gautieria morchelliformis]|nr:hypothetical protein JB92DRAFT_2835753 [Gautieria morchelliformis]
MGATPPVDSIGTSNATTEILSLVKTSRIKFFVCYYLGTGLISVVGTSFSMLSIAKSRPKVFVNRQIFDAMCGDGTCSSTTFSDGTVVRHAFPEAYGKLLAFLLAWLPGVLLRVQLAASIGLALAAPAITFLCFCWTVLVVYLARESRRESIPCMEVLACTVTASKGPLPQEMQTGMCPLKRGKRCQSKVKCFICKLQTHSSNDNMNFPYNIKPAVGCELRMSSKSVGKQKVLAGMEPVITYMGCLRRSNGNADMFRQEGQQLQARESIWGRGTYGPAEGVKDRGPRSALIRITL